MRFPVVKTQDLNRRSITLPHEMDGDFNLLLLGYEQWQQAQYETWVPFAERLEKEYPAFRYYELPIINRQNPLSRWFIDEGMRAGIPNLETRSRVLTLYLNKNQFNRDVGVVSEDDISVLLVTRDGTIFWRAMGNWSPEKADELDDVLLSQTPLRQM